jgi:hypothetical protein
MAPQAFARNFIDKYDADGPIARYPNPDIAGLDKRFKYKMGNTPSIRHYRGTLSRRAIRTATSSTIRDGRSRSSTAPVALAAANLTAAIPYWPTRRPTARG